MSQRRRTSALHRGILRAVLRAVSRPRLTLVVAGAALLACALLAVFRLDISTSQNELFDRDVPFFRDYLRFTQLFPENEAVYVVVQSRDPRGVPPVERWTALADAITTRLKAMPQYVKSVDAKVPVEALGDQGLLFDDPQRVRENFAEMKRFLPLARLWGEEPAALARALGSSPMERFLAALRLQPPDAETAGFVAALAGGWNNTVDDASTDSDNGPALSNIHPTPLRVRHHVPDLAALGATDPSRLGYYYVPDDTDDTRSLLLVRVYENAQYTSLTAISETVESIRSAVADVALAYPEFTTGVTGRPALEADEMRTSDRDSHRAEVVALAAVFLGVVLMLRSAWLALAGEVALGVGIGWTFGWATLSVGNLNLLSIVFLLALIGIGMDYLVQILTRYRQEAARRSQPRAVWVAVFRHVAAPINTACAGAAGAFLVSALTRFRGAAQLGVIAGGGLLLCLLAGYVVLPALLTLLPPKFARRRNEPDGPELGPPARATWRTFVAPVVWVGLLLAGIPFALRTGFDPGLISMQAPNLESVKLVDKLQTWSAAVLARDLETLRRARAAVRGSPEVGRTESILLAYDNLDWLRAHESELSDVRWETPAPVAPVDLPRIAAGAEAVARRFAASVPGGATTALAAAPSGPFADAAAALSSFARKLGGLDGRSAARVADWLTEWEVAFVAQLRSLLAPFHPTGLDVSRLPPELKSHFVAPDGTYALYVYPRANLWEHANLAAFVRDVEARVATVPGERTLTGIAPNIFHTTASIKISFGRATFYALGLIFVLVLVDLRNLRQTLFAVSVLALGLPMLVALMGLLGVDWNFANFFGLPILIGAGHEYGVFLVHRYREAAGDPRRVWRRWDVSDRALLLCAYVTTASFGFFWMLAHHRGLKSLGLVMALGTACVYCAAVLVLRPLLLWRLARNAGTATGTRT